MKKNVFNKSENISESVDIDWSSLSSVWQLQTVSVQNLFNKQVLYNNT